MPRLVAACGTRARLDPGWGSGDGFGELLGPGHGKKMAFCEKVRRGAPAPTAKLTSHTPLPISPAAVEDARRFLEALFRSEVRRLETDLRNGPGASEIRRGAVTSAAADAALTLLLAGDGGLNVVQVEFSEDAAFLNLDALPKGWSYSVQEQAFYLDYEDGFVAGELSEKNMNAEDKAKFAEAKRAELQSFFDNQVWEQDKNEVKDPNKVHYSLMLDPTRDPRLNGTMTVLGKSALVVDAKALYDAAQKPHVHNFDDKRTGIEVQVLKERMTASATGWYWVSSERQFADGFTKLAARQLLADRLRTGTISLKFDEKFQAAKKKTAKDRQEEAKRFATSRPKMSTKDVAAMASLTGTAASQVDTYKDKIETALVEFEWTDSPKMWTEKPVPALPEPEPEKERVQTKAPKEKKVKLSSIKWDVGCQGPATYTRDGASASFRLALPPADAHVGRASGARSGTAAKLSSKGSVRRWFASKFPKWPYPFLSDAELDALAQRPARSVPPFAYCGPALHLGSRAALVGDAIHAMKPYVGLGVNSGLEDVSVLDNCLWRADGGLSQALAAFSAQRAPDARSLVEMQHGLDQPGRLRTLLFVVGPAKVDALCCRLLPSVFSPSVFKLFDGCSLPFAQIQVMKRRDRKLQLAVLALAVVVSGVSFGRLVYLVRTFLLWPLIEALLFG
ncbi:unnamed protein product [Prorocentrum cordatum]|uniref:FAD-binding domain-containing protein n=1 Tax=Prorocentrum cordatum TaxID=2364126 RepID=A0ABN9R095_9DINO|nr:unnamed protein product [Polarella glacialis]